MIAFAVMAYQYFEKKKEGLVIVFAALAILFQPLYEIALGRTMWNVVDVVVAMGLVILWYKEQQIDKSK